MEKQITWQIFHYDDPGFELNAQITMTGHEYQRLSDSYHWHGLKRGDVDYLVWQRTISGGGELRFESQSFKIGPGMAMLLPLPHDHEYRVDGDAGFWEFEFIIMRGQECLRIGREITRTHGPLLKYAEETGSLRCARTIFGQRESNTLKMSGLAYEFVMLLAREFHETGCRRFVNASSGLYQSRQLAIREYQRHISVREMAAAAGMSYAHFIRAFTDTFHVSPGKFINGLQLDMALHLIQNSTLSIKEIASRCGFSSGNYFCHVFTTKYQFSPERYRSTL